MPDTPLQLLATDPRQSVLMRLGASKSAPFMPFGYSPEQCRPVGYGGLHLEPEGVFLLGNGYRGYSPTLLRFIRPDDWSPFGAGGLSCYAYCMGDPMNSHDPKGHSPIGWITKLFRSAENWVHGMWGFGPSVASKTKYPSIWLDVPKRSVSRSSSRGALVSSSRVTSVRTKPAQGESGSSTSLLQTQIQPSYK